MNIKPYNIFNNLLIIIILTRYTIKEGIVIKRYINTVKAINYNKRRRIKRAAKYRAKYNKDTVFSNLDVTLSDI